MSTSSAETTFPERGVLYIAFGRRYVNEAIFSARSLKKFCPHIHISLFSDIEPEESCFDYFRAIEAKHKRCKIDYIPQSPYARTIYLDSDTKIVFPIDDLFDVLDRFDLAACHDFSRKSIPMTKAIPEYARIPYGLSEHNSGVIAYRKSESTSAFFEDWRKLYYENREATSGMDQPSFRIALWRNNLRILTLPPEFNVRNLRTQNGARRRARDPQSPEKMRARIFHWHRLHQWRSLLPIAKYRPSKY